jgi:uncharacterized protein YbcI
LKSKPTWSNTSGYSATSAFFAAAARNRPNKEGIDLMGKSGLSMEQQIAQAASAFEQQRTGHVPKSVTVLLSEDILLITLRGALSPAEMTLAQTPAGITQLQEFHRQLFATSSGSLWQDIKKITGVEVREASAEVETMTSAVTQVFATGTVVQVFLLADTIEMETWNGKDPVGSAGSA